jgi:UDP-2,4-diacetamido-2,4,6-trideoxy-beta-L-altropyranose hydrolase
MTKCALIRADGNKEIGHGHWYRSYCFVEYLLEQGWSVQLVTAYPEQYPKGLKPLNDQFTLTKIPVSGTESQDALHTMGCATQIPDLVIVDHYQLGCDWESFWTESLVLAIDDLKRAHAPDSFVLDYFPDRTEADYPQVSPDHLLLGLSYLLLRREFQTVSKQSERTEPRKTFLVAFGGSDPKQYGSEVLNVLHKHLSNGCKVIWLCPDRPSSDFWTRNDITLQRMSVCNEMASLYQQVDLCFGAAGVSTWERLAVGLPAVVWNTAKNQRDNAAFLKNTQGVLVQTTSPVEDTSWIDRLMDIPAPDQAELNALGVERTFVKIEPFLRSRESLFWFEKLTQNGVKDLYRLQCIPGIRQYFRNPEIPTWEEHQDWCQSLMSDQQQNGWLLRAEGKAIAWLKLQSLKAENTFEASLLVDPEWQGQGIGLRLLKFAQLNAKVFGFNLFAEVLPNNTVSLKLFRKAGFLSAQNGLIWKSEP